MVVSVRQETDWVVAGSSSHVNTTLSGNGVGAWVSFDEYAVGSQLSCADKLKDKIRLIKINLSSEKYDKAILHF